MSDEMKRQDYCAPSPVELLERKLEYQGSILKVYRDTVKVGDHITYWDFIHHNGAAAVLPVTREGKILMVRQYRHALKRWTLEIPAGKLDSPEESMEACAARELEEETGFRCDQLEYLMTVNTTVAFCDEKIGIYLARDLQPSKQHLDPDEVIQVEEWELRELMNMIRSGKMTDGKTAAAIMTYAATCTDRD